MSMEKLKCPVCSHYALCSIGGEITDTQARTCKAYSYIPTPSAPRPIHSPVDHYDVDASTGTVSYHVVTTNADRIRAMSDEELASLFGVWVADCDNNDVPCKNYCSYYRSCGDAWLAWLKDEVKDG